MDKDTIILYAKKLRLPLLVLIMGLIACFMLIKMLIPTVKDFVEVNKNVSEKNKSIQENQKKLEELKTTMKQKMDKQADPIKDFYKPIESGLDTEAVMAEAFGDILKVIRENSIKTRAVKYDYNPSDDNFVKNASSKYNVCTLSLEMISDYKHFQAFLRDLYKHEHFLEISNIEIVPYEKDKKILLIKSQIKLYSQKSEADAATPAPESTSTAPAEQTAPPDISKK